MQNHQAFLQNRLPVLSIPEGCRMLAGGSTAGICHAMRRIPEGMREVLKLKMPRTGKKT